MKHINSELQIKEETALAAEIQDELEIEEDGDLEELIIKGKLDEVANRSVRERACKNENCQCRDR
jgi:hypothetical protein